MCTTMFGPSGEWVRSLGDLAEFIDPSRILVTPWSGGPAEPISAHDFNNSLNDCLCWVDIPRTFAADRTWQASPDPEWGGDWVISKREEAPE